MGARSVNNTGCDSDILSVVADQAGRPVQDVRLISELLFRELHKRQYETETDDYLCGRLLHELPDYAWIHLYQFLLLFQLRNGNAKVSNDDLISDSHVQLQYLGGAPDWKKYFFEMSHWKMASKYGRDQGIYG